MDFNLTSFQLCLLYCLSRKGHPMTVEYSGTVKGESAMKTLSDIGSKIVHTYEVYNHGPWKASHFNVEIHWPHQVGNNNSWPEGKWLLYLERAPEIIGDGECFPPPNVQNVLNLPVPSTPSSPENPPRSSQNQNQNNQSSSSSRTRRGAETVVSPDIEETTDGRKTKVVKMVCER